jgi:hypothetical protein
MSVGNNPPFMGWASVLGIAKETTFGTFVTSTTFLEFNSESLKAQRDVKILESINSTRDAKKRMLGNQSADGSLELDLNLASDGIVYLIKQAMGGTCSTAVVSAASSFTHTLYAGDMENNGWTAGSTRMKSLSMAVRRGGQDAPTYNFFGMRVNTLTIKAEVGSPVIMTAELIGSGCSISSTIPTVTLTDIVPLNFSEITIQTGLTSTTLSTEYYKSFEFSINNNLNGDFRVLGNIGRAAIPAQKRETKLKLTQSFDTTTAYDRYINNTPTYFKISFDGITIPASATKYHMDILLPWVVFGPAFPNVDGPDALEYEIEADCFWSSVTSYSVQMAITNGTANYD